MGCFIRWPCPARGSPGHHRRFAHASYRVSHRTDVSRRATGGARPTNETSIEPQFFALLGRKTRPCRVHPTAARSSRGGTRVARATSSCCHDNEAGFPFASPAPASAPARPRRQRTSFAALLQNRAAARSRTRHVRRRRNAGRDRRITATRKNGRIAHLELLLLPLTPRPRTDQLTACWRRSRRSRHLRISS